MQAHDDCGQEVEEHDKPPKRWVMMVTAKDDGRNCLGNGTWEVNQAIMLSRGGSRET